MEFASYADEAVRLANAPLPDVQALREHLAGGAERAGARDLVTVRGLQRRLREVFALAAAGRDAAVIDALNALLARSPLVASVATADGGRRMLAVTARSAAPGDDLAARALVGLAATVVAHGAGRLGVCAALGCPDAFVDTSPGGTRRYCSPRCASRSNVAAFRARARRH